MLSFASVAAAGVSGSSHDFSAISQLSGQEGVCAPCHKPHFSTAARGIWRRDLTQETSFFGGSNVPSGQNYAVGDTLACLDCHDNHSAVDNDPASALFGTDVPQDVAFDDDMKTTSYGTWDGVGVSQPVGAKFGYFEDRYSGATLYRRGGHYFKVDPDGIGPLKAYDKLPCSDCHDPHDTSNGVFIKKVLGGKSVTGVLASPKSRTGGGTGREFCSACHGYAGGSSVAWSAVNAAYTTGGNIPVTPTTVSGIILGAHQSGSTVPCVNCHPHQMVQTSCADCHGFPPVVDGTSPNYFDPIARPTVENYENGAGAHQRHKDAMGTKFTCEICHGPNPGSDTWHNPGSTTVVAQNQVDIMGRTEYWDPDGIYTSVYTGIASGETLPPLYELKAKGGNDGGPAVGGRCAGVACHGNPPNSVGALNWTDKMYVDATTNDVAICQWCHDSDQAIWRIDAGTKVYAPNMMGSRLYADVPSYGGGADGTDYGANKTGHGRTTAYYRTANPAANKSCFKCHDTTYTLGIGPVRTHFDGVVPTLTSTLDSKRLWASINGQAVTGDDATVCTACHRSGGADAVTDAGNIVSVHGNNDYPNRREVVFSRQCRACHEPHGLTYPGSGSPNIAMVDDRVDTNNDGHKTVADNQVAFTDLAVAADYASMTYDGNYTNGVCETCHSATGWFERDGTPGGPGGGGSGIPPHDTTLTRCPKCHLHNVDTSFATIDGFMPRGGTDIDQFFDGSSTNYNDVSNHPQTISGALSYAGSPDCLWCHRGAVTSTGTGNECLKCHFDNSPNQDNPGTEGSHLDKIVQLADPTTGSNGSLPTGISMSVGLPGSTPGDQRLTTNYRTFCAGCHRASPSMTLAGQTPKNVTADFTTTGHGATVTLSGERGANGAGPANNDCRHCHMSTVPTATGDPLRDIWPGPHASINYWLVSNTRAPYQTAEFDSPDDENNWCLGKCHRTDGGLATLDNNTDNGVASDNNVVDHTWDVNNGENIGSTLAGGNNHNNLTKIQSGCPLIGDPNATLCQTHPSNIAITVGPHYKLPAATMLLSTYPGGASGRVVCHTCHDPHGTAAVGGQMLRFTASGAANICAQCHQ
jgi:hypothetical protein